MEELIKVLPLLIPVIIVEMGLLIFALIHVLKHKTYRFGNRALWIIIVVFIQIIGPIVYLTMGKGEEE